MAYAITQTCCADASCVAVCPVNCIHPTPEERDFGSTEMLHVDPRTCIDCGACADACPVDAIFPVDRLRGPDTVYADLNAGYYSDRPPADEWAPPAFPRALPPDVRELRVAVVGTGPAACYTARGLLLAGARVTMYERLPVPGGLARFGVAPDHPATRRIAETLTSFRHNPRLQLRLGCEVGRDVPAAQVAAEHHAVVWAVGAAGDRRLGIPGEDLPGSLAATSLVGWYNGHPDVAGLPVDLSARRAVVVGTGNVALDVARMLAGDPSRLAGTDIAPAALSALQGSAVREVVLLGRRGPADAAWSRAELLGLLALPRVRVVVDDRPGVREAIAAAAPGSTAALLAGLPLEPLGRTSDERRVVLGFGATAVGLGGDDRVASVRLADGRTLDAGLVLRATGSRGLPVDGLPYDGATGTVPHEAGRVEPGTYVVGWIKRGATGGIGANKQCAAETVDTLLADAADGLLSAPRAGRLGRMLARAAQ
jgi:ferredoxin--NADP+ reductase